MLQKIRNWYNTKERAPITLKNILAVFQSFYRRNNKIPKHIEEQVNLLRIPLSRKECKYTNLCICGCSWDELIWADKQCDGKCYPQMMNKKDWKVFKKEQNIKTYD